MKVWRMGSLLHTCLLSVFTLALTPFSSHASERSAEQEFNRVRLDPVELRQFLFHFPKGGDLHNHIDGAVYAENMIRWAAEDGRCVSLASHRISAPPCDPENDRPAVASIASNGDVVEQLIDAYSIRNYEMRPVAGNVQFFSTFPLFYLASVGREGDMLSEASLRAARQNTYYLELMQSWGMGSARATAGKFPGQDKETEMAYDLAIDQIASEAMAIIDSAEQRRRELQSCGREDADPACDVEVAYLAQVLRTFPRPQVRAQTKLAVRLMERDPRVVGLNFVAPENAPVSLRDYSWQMQMIAEETKDLPEQQRQVALHAGELTLGLVPPEELGFHVREAIEIAGARRIGHGIDIIYDSKRDELLERMANEGIVVEINLTSNEVILGVSGDYHPFNLYREHGVPLTLSTDDEGVSRIDLTHEYQRAVETYKLSYGDIKQLARNALAYSFQPGQNLFDSTDYKRFTGPCRRARVGQSPLTGECKELLASSKKARMQSQLEESFVEFEARFR
ncbi:MAG: hypothetical protein KJP04_07770 [Arenicella sp.]|nr:hypothetical protein [Arenicella sp.]